MKKSKNLRPAVEEGNVGKGKQLTNTEAGPLSFFLVKPHFKPFQLAHGQSGEAPPHPGYGTFFFVPFSVYSLLPLSHMVRVFVPRYYPFSSTAMW
jgi:hypothetical protein